MSQNQKNLDLESFDKMSTNMFDSRINLVGATAEVEGEYNKLTLEIRSLEQQLIKRTSRVLQNTDMLKEFQQFKVD